MSQPLPFRRRSFRFPKLPPHRLRRRYYPAAAGIFISLAPPPPRRIFHFHRLAPARHVVVVRETREEEDSPLFPRRGLELIGLFLRTGAKLSQNFAPVGDDRVYGDDWYCRAIGEGRIDGGRLQGGIFQKTQ